jgi:hypothetical protein
MDALAAATQQWEMEISLHKTDAMVLDPRRSKAAQHMCCTATVTPFSQHRSLPLSCPSLACCS